MHPQDETVFKRYKWVLQHPIWWQVLLYLLLAVYFVCRLFFPEIQHTAYDIALHICVFVPIALLFAGQIFPERQVDKVLKRLDMQGASVRELLQIYESLYADIDFSKRRYADTYCNYVLSAAPLYMFIGEFDRAIELYQNLLSAKHKKAVPKGMRPVILGDLADCQAEKGDADAARKTMQKSAEVLQKMFRHNRKRREQTEENLNACTRAKLALQCGNPAPMAKILAELPPPKTPYSPLQQTSLERLKGWTAYVQGDCAKAQRAYTYVSEHGKGTFYEQEAKYYLDKIREQNAN